MSKRKGSRAELKCVHILEAAGYLVTKAGGSLGMFDVIGLGPNDIRAIQVKAGGARMSALEIEQVRDLTLADNVSTEYWRFEDYARKPLIQILTRY